MYRDSKRKTLFCFLLSMVIALCLAGISISFILKTGLVGKQRYKQSLTHSSYIENNQGKILREITSLVEDKGLNEEITNEIAAYDMVYLQILNSVDHIYSGNDTALELDAIKSYVSQAVNDYLQTNAITLTAEMEQTMEQVIESAAEIYKDNMGIEDTKGFIEFSNKVSHMASKGKLLCLGAAMIALILLNLLTRYRYQTIGYLAKSAVMASILNVAAVFFLLKFGLKEQLYQALAYDAERLQWSISVFIKEGIAVTLVLGLGILFLSGLKNVIRNKIQ